MGKRKIGKWDIFLIISILVAASFTVLAPRIRANIVYDRPLFDLTTEVDTDIFVENAPPKTQIALGWFDLFSKAIFSVLLFAVGTFVVKLYAKAGWFKGR